MTARTKTYLMAKIFELYVFDFHHTKFVFFHAWVDFFVILGGFGVVWGVILGAKGRPKWLQNLIKKMSDFWIALGRALGRQRAVQVS